MSTELARAREYEKEHVGLITEDERPAYHVSAPVGWLNDPNGFSVYKGEYHLFYQYHPYQAVWGPMHWGHVKTKDFVTWEYLPAAFAPDQPYDDSGCFSGSAVETPDGRHLICYTGVQHVADGTGFPRNIQQQCMAVGNGSDYEKYEGNPVITVEDLPEGCSPSDFRDPKIWREEDGYRMIVSCRLPDGNGGALLFSSEDGFDWSFVSVVLAGRGEIGKMWECPDFFRLCGEEVLIVSPMEMVQKGLEYHAGFGNVCVVGNMDPAKNEFLPRSMHSVDYGLDFYAMQTLESPDGRRIMIAWMQNWATVSSMRKDLRIAGEMTFPRELSVRNGRLTQNPVREIEDYYDGDGIRKKVTLESGKVSFDDVSGRILDMTVTVYIDWNNPFTAFRIYLAEDSENSVTIRYRPAKRTVRIDRSRCSYSYDIVNAREFYVKEYEGRVRLRMLLDRHSVELFVNDGEQAATSLIYAPTSASGISFESEGRVNMEVEVHKLRLRENAVQMITSEK